MSVQGAGGQAGKRARARQCVRWWREVRWQWAWRDFPRVRRYISPHPVSDEVVAYFDELERRKSPAPGTGATRKDILDA